MIQPQRPIALLTHVLRAESGLYWRVRGFGGTVGPLAWAYPMTQFDAEQRVRGMLCPEGHLFVSERLAEPISI
jgi:hypothetical protein